MKKPSGDCHPEPVEGSLTVKHDYHYKLPYTQPCLLPTAGRRLPEDNPIAIGSGQAIGGECLVLLA